MTRITALKALVLAWAVAMVVIAFRIDADLLRARPSQPHCHRWHPHDRAPTPGERT